ncbi:MAG: putative family CoA-transferase [Acidimicrobiia bacterium]|nr:putative family CoA-transferase [Acidimicrobiia bacterium]
MLPLVGVRVVDLTDGIGEGCGRYLSDLGADVVLVEPPGGVASRRAFPLFRGVSIPFVVHGANKRSVVIDWEDPDGRSELLALLGDADIWIDGTRPGSLASFDLDPARVRQLLPNLVVVSISDFGQSGPYRDWVATEWVHLAMSGALSRSGVPGRPPLMPPASLGAESASIQAAWVALLGYWARLEGGHGDHLDVSIFEATAMTVDPGVGTAGTAAAALAIEPALRGRPPARMYPIFPCSAGHVRVVLLAPRQWRGMFDWLGQPEQFQAPEFNRNDVRFRAWRKLYPLMGALLQPLTMLELVQEGQRRGIPIAPVLNPAEVLKLEHFAARGAWADVEVAGSKGQVPAGYVSIDGERAGVRTPAPAVDEHRGTVEWSAREKVETCPAAASPPLRGLRVLDLGVIVMGAEAGRLFADQGAEVIKVENRQYPDGLRATGMTANLAAGQRNKLSLGLNLRDTEGRVLFERLVALSDVVLTNFKPGTMESLELAPARLREINPGVVVVTSSAMGEWGPWRDWMGYGPLVRCVSGLTSLWRDVGAEDGFGDGSTIYPDHVVGRIVDVAVLAALIARRRTGHGAHIESSQAEAIITALAGTFLRESLEPGTAIPRAVGEADAPWGVYPCAGDDEWCVVTVRDDGDWARLRDALGHPQWMLDQTLSTTEGRVRARTAIDRELTAWTSARSPRDVAQILQRYGVPAGPMQRPDEYTCDPHLLARGFFRRYVQPHVGEVVNENGPCVAERIPDPQLRPAPFHGEHTRLICRELLGLDDVTVDDLLQRGILEETEANREGHLP